jgi:aminoglycoside 2''-phosphotransferase
MKSLKTATAPVPLLPPFYEDPPVVEPSFFLKRIEEEFRLHVERYAYLIDAFDHDVFVVNEEWVFRFPRTDGDREHLAREIAFLDKAASSFEANVPKYTYVSKRGDFAGYPMINRYVLSPWEFRKLDDGKKRDAVDQLTAFVSTFHTLDAEEFVPYERRQREEFIGFDRRVRAALVEQLFPKLDQQETKTIEDFYESLADLFRVEPSVCPTHGDLYAFNVVWDEHSSKIGVIDFSDLVMGDPANDFEVFFDYGREYAEIAYEGYVGTKDSRFLERAEAYYRLHAIYTLLSSQLGARITFDHSRMRFRQKFSLDPLS